MILTSLYDWEHLSNFKNLNFVS